MTRRRSAEARSSYATASRVKMPGEALLQTPEQETAPAGGCGGCSEGRGFVVSPSAKRQRRAGGRALKMPGEALLQTPEQETAPAGGCGGCSEGRGFVVSPSAKRQRRAGGRALYASLAFVSAAGSATGSPYSSMVPLARPSRYFSRAAPRRNVTSALPMCS